MNVWKSTGKLRYDPHVERGTFRPFWVILQCDRELVRYYQHIFYTLYFKRLQTAMWGSHCSIARGEKPLRPENWKLFAGKEIEFSYSYDGEFYSNSDKGGKHFWIKCWSEEFGDIRESLGLPRTPKIPYHISIGSLSL
jgi:hypothetical protein